MPRGDGKKENSPRPNIKKTDAAQLVPKKLRVRQQWWEKDFNGQGFTEKDKHDGKGNSFRKPGSQNNRK